MTRISQLNTLTSVTDSTTRPVIDGGTTKKVTLSTVKTAILRPATNAVPGVVKVGNGLNVTSDGQDLQGAPNLFLYYKKEREVLGNVFPKINYQSRPATGAVWPRRRIRQTL